MANHTNPYVAGAPVTDQRMFFGREDVFTWIEQNIGGQFSENMLVIHGQRRVGKTSVLKQLGNYLPDNYIPVFFDFQGRTHTTISNFLYRLATWVKFDCKLFYDTHSANSFHFQIADSLQSGFYQYNIV